MYIMSFDIFFGEEKFSWLSSKNKVADEDFHFQRHENVFVKLQCLVLELLFISHLVIFLTLQRPQVCFASHYH